VACQNQEEEIVGKWQAVTYIENGEKNELEHFIEFKPEGIVVISENGFNESQNGKMTYQIEDDSIYFARTTRILDGTSHEKESLKFEFIDERLILTNERNGVSTLTRVKIKD
jgi:hypothetical protein